jgi:threonine/homoserine/homoserine lactone efflux protein
VLVIVTPGPDTAVTIRSTLLGGRRAGLMTATGVVTGQACWTLAASAGITALLVASEPAFLALKLAGAAYLVYLGAQALVAAWRGARVGGASVRGPGRPRMGVPGGPRVDAGDAPRLARAGAYRQGLISDLSNPKMAAFFTSLLPQFGTTSAGPSFWLMLGFGLLFCLLTWLWLALYAAALDRLGRTLPRERVRRAIEAASGAVLVALGIRLAAEPRPR